MCRKKTKFPKLYCISTVRTISENQSVPMIRSLECLPYCKLKYSMQYLVHQQYHVTCAVLCMLYMSHYSAVVQCSLSCQHVKAGSVISHVTKQSILKDLCPVSFTYQLIKVSSLFVNDSLQIILNIYLFFQLIKYLNCLRLRLYFFVNKDFYLNSSEKNIYTS